MLKNNLGFPRIGSHRQLKKACEQYWSEQISKEELFSAGRSICHDNWQQQLNAGIDLIPCNDFSYYDHVLDMSLLLGAIPSRYTPVLTEVKGNTEIDLCFAMARGYQKDGLDITAMEMTKWFDTNYHYIVPEFTKRQEFRIFSEKAFAEFIDAKQYVGTTATVKPVLIGPVSFLLLGKEKEAAGLEDSFHRIDLIQNLLPVYIEVIRKFRDYGASWIQLDEPFLSLDLTDKEKAAFKHAYTEINKKCPGIRVILTSYFDALDDNTELAVKLPVSALHIDLVRNREQLNTILKLIPGNLMLSLGIIDGRNIWKNEYAKSLSLLEQAITGLGKERIMIAPSCSLLHTPVDLDLEVKLLPEVKSWMSFARQKLNELSELSSICDGNKEFLDWNTALHEKKRSSPLIHQPEIKHRTSALTEEDARRKSVFSERQKIQHEKFRLPLLPTTTIGSFPQTGDIRQLRARLKRGEINKVRYDESIKSAITEVVRLQEDIGLDVLVHGEFERNDMVEYFGEMLEGFVFTQYGWVQSYGSRCVKPPVIFGDIKRVEDMTVRWISFAQSITNRPVKGMLTGPVTILQWSFVRDDQPRSETAFQIALALRDEVQALEQSGIGIIQMDEPAIREGLPLRKKNRAAYLEWAIRAFGISVSGVKDETQIHTHMCYSEFNDIIHSIVRMDADVITIETSRSQMDLLNAFVDFRYPNEIGPGLYDIHSPRVPSVEEMVKLLEKAADSLPVENLWVNPDCGLKTRKWPETKQALINMVRAAEKVRESVNQNLV